MARRENLLTAMYKTYYTYIMSNRYDTVLYTGVTGNIEKRMSEHKTGAKKGFTTRYNCHKLVYYEQFSSIDEAIEREKQIKSWKRIKKDRLIDSVNPLRVDLYDIQAEILTSPLRGSSE